MLFSHPSILRSINYLSSNTRWGVLFTSFSCIGSLGKNKGGHVFYKLDKTKLNAHLKDLMPGLTAKVFRTYNASITLDTFVSWMQISLSALHHYVAVLFRLDEEIASSTSQVKHFRSLCRTVCFCIVSFIASDNPVIYFLTIFPK